MADTTEKDIFARTPLYGDSLSADQLRLNFTEFQGEGAAAGAAVGLIVQNVAIQYQQSVTRLYALEDGAIYFVAGPTRGQGSLQHAVGPQGLQVAFFEKYGDVCKIKGGVFNMSMFAGCSAAAQKAKVTLSNPLINGVDIRVNAGDAVIANNITFEFSKMSMSN